MEYFRVQLKVCEGCGGLWFRTEALARVYCAGCSGKMAVHAKAGADKRSGRRAKHRTEMQSRGMQSQRMQSQGGAR